MFKCLSISFFFVFTDYVWDRGKCSVASKKVESVLGVIEKTIDNFKCFIAQNDFDTGVIEQRRIAQKDLSKELEKNRKILSNPELSDKFVEMVMLIKKFRARSDLDDKVKSDICWPFS